MFHPSSPLSTLVLTLEVQAPFFYTNHQPTCINWWLTSRANKSSCHGKWSLSQGNKIKLSRLIWLVRGATNSHQTIQKLFPLKERHLRTPTPTFEVRTPMTKAIWMGEKNKQLPPHFSLFHPPPCPNKNSGRHPPRTTTTTAGWGASCNSPMVLPKSTSRTTPSPPKRRPWEMGNDDLCKGQTYQEFLRVIAHFKFWV